MFRLVKLIFLIIFILIVKFSEKLKLPKILKPISIIVIVFIVAIDILNPFQGMLSYKTPEEVYTHNVKNDYINMVEGENSCVFLYEKKEATFSTLFVSNDGNRYKKCSYFDKETIDSTFYKGISIDLIHIKNTNDYYLYIFGMAENIQISDNLDTNFDVIYKQLSGQSVIICIAPIPYTANYELYINGKVIHFER